MKTVSQLISMMLLSVAETSYAAEGDGMQHMHHHNMMDNRISLNLSPEMKQHQLSNMRSHVEAVQSIVGLLSSGDFDQAAQVAHSRLGLTDEMRKMCTSFNNDKYNQLGLAFHKSGDELGNVLKSKDMSKSLQALHDTMNYCVQCHSTFRQ
ncbi:MAG: cytochrome C [Gallionellales bacterium GWA2_59_43]|nr:MAG: cytochrome C [Gallionellales bacterium GWA2_59_43]